MFLDDESASKSVVVRLCHVAVVVVGERNSKGVYGVRFAVTTNNVMVRAPSQPDGAGVLCTWSIDEKTHSALIKSAKAFYVGRCGK